MEEFFNQALGLVHPWTVVACDFCPKTKRLAIKIDFVKGSRFPDPSGDGDELCPVHDTVSRRWEHLKFFEHQTLLEARVPRIKNAEGKVKTVKVPWAEAHSGYRGQEELVWSSRRVRIYTYQACRLARLVNFKIN